MARRHQLRAGDWASIATRLDEIVCAHSGEDPFEETFKLLLAKVLEERGATPARTPAEVDALLAEAARRWPGLVEPGARCMLSATELERCAAVLRTGALLHDDLVGLDAIFEHLRTRAAKGEKGQFFTPRHVADVAVRIVAPRPGERVLDPACGSGAFLRRVLHRAPQARVAGWDLDARAVRVARVGLAVCDVDPAAVERRDSLVRADEEPVDVIVTNPPFAGDVGPDYARAYTLGRDRRVERDVLFLERCLELLRPGGRLAIVLPHNKVGAARWAYAREWLLERARVVGVIGLGRETFLPHTSQKAALLIARKRARPPDADEELLFYVSERSGKDSAGVPTLRADGSLDHDLDDAVAPFRAALEDPRWAD